MNSMANANIWKVAAEERAKHDQQFFTLKPLNGLITGDQAREFFLKSGLPSAILAQIWELADINKDGKMDRREFSIGMHLIQKKLQGFNIPSTLPESMKQDPDVTVGLFQPGAFGTGIGTNTGFTQQPMMTQPVPPLGYAMGAGQSMMTPPMMIPSAVSPTAKSTGKPDWTMQQTTKLKYSQQFNSIDKNKTGMLSGAHARNIFTQSGLSTQTLAQIWFLSDLDKDGNLTVEEFCIAMHLIDMAKAGATLPGTLPSDLLPPHLQQLQRQRTMSIGSNEDSVGGSAGSPADDSILKGPKMAASFEDKRRQNFERGQAELDRRRQVLQEQERREREERERKEREEMERRERERMETERRRQLEMEKIMAKQREEQQKQEEEYKRMMEQREAARRELERQRQQEWERQRLQELTAQWQREQESFCHAKQKQKNLLFQLQALNEKSDELNNQITEMRHKIVTVTSAIEAMKTDRDTKLIDIEQAKRAMNELHAKAAHCANEKQRLMTHRMAQGGESSNSESYTQVMHTFRNREMNLDTLRQSLSQIDTELRQKQTGIDEKERTFNQCARTAKETAEEYRELVQNFNNVLSKVQKARGVAVNDHWSSANTNGRIAGFDDNAWDHAASQSGQNSEAWANDTWSASNGHEPLAPNTHRYRALYEFSASNDDELSFQAGDIIIVFKDHVGDEGWMAGQIGNKVGWFPEAFAEPTEENDVGHAGRRDEQPALMQKLESIQEVSFEREDEHRASLRKESAERKQLHPETVIPQATQMAYAQFAWKAKTENHLSFNKGDQIRILEKQEMWWRGELNGVSGWFPKSYVKLGDGARRKSETPESSVPKGKEAVPPSAQRKSESQEFPSQQHQPQLQHPQQAPTAEGKWFEAVYAFVASEGGDLGFDAGDKIFVIQDVGDWWTGRLDGREGVFPASYVKPLEENLTSKEETKAPVIKTPSIAEEPNEEPQEEVQYEIGKAIAEYQATDGNQLTLQPGDLVKIRAKSPTGWWEGELQRKGEGKRIGWFPGNYVEILLSKSTSGEQQQHSATADADNKRELVEALFDYAKQHDDELAFSRGAVISVLQKIDDNWWQGELEDGQKGLFPANYVKPCETDATRCEKRETEIARDETGGGRADEESPSTNAAVANGDSRKRSMYCQELEQTEQNFIDDLHMVTEVFYKQLHVSGLLTSKELYTLFINWPELTESARAFLKDIRSYGEDRVGTAILKNMPRLRETFVAFCRDQQTALEFLAAKEKASARFRAAHAQCSQHPAARGLQLSYFLLIPLARVTKYHLVVNEILKHTPSGHDGYESLRQAHTALRGLCDEVNEVATETENLQMLYWCQNHVKCEQIVPKLVFHSSTNSCGARRLLHSGILYKAKSNRLLLGLLFNDFLMLATPDDVLDKPESFKLSRNSDLIFSMYKMPILLSKAVLQPPVSNPDAGDESQLALQYGENLVSLKALNVNAKTLWYKQLEKAIKQARDAVSRRTNTPTANAGIGRLLLEVVFVRNLTVPQDCSAKGAPIYIEFLLDQQRHTKPIDLTRTDTLCTTQLSLDSKTSVVKLAIHIERLYSPDICIGRTEIALADMLKMSGSQRNPAVKQLPLTSDFSVQTDAVAGHIIVKFVVQLYDDQ